VPFKTQTPSFKFSSWLLCIAWNLGTFIAVFWWSVSTVFMYTPKHISWRYEAPTFLRIVKEYQGCTFHWVCCGFSLFVSFLAMLAFKHLWCTCFWIWWKLMECMWHLASWMWKYSTLPNSGAYVVFLHGMLVTSVQVQVHKLNSVPNLRPNVYECRGLCLKSCLKANILSTANTHYTENGMKWHKQ
jgi:hypothetical protein